MGGAVNRARLLAPLLLVLLLGPGCAAPPTQVTAPPVATESPTGAFIPTSGLVQGPGRLLGSPPPGIVPDVARFATSFEHERPDEKPRVSPGPPGEPGTPSHEGGGGYGAPGCDYATVAPLAPVALADYLQERNYGCLYFLWSYTSQSPGVWAKPKMMEVLNRTQGAVDAYNHTDALHLRELLFFLRIGYYHRFYHPAEFPFDADVYSATNAVLAAFEARPDVNRFAIEPAQILEEWVNLVDAAFLGHLHLGLVKQILVDFRQAPARWASYYQQVLAWSTLYLVHREARHNLDFQAVVDAQLLQRLRALANSTAVADIVVSVVNSAIWALGPLAQLPVHRNATLEALTDALDTHAYLSEPYLWTVYTLDRFAECQTARPGERICRSDLAPRIEALVFPYRYGFDDGALVFRTNLTMAGVLPLYYAVQVVEGQVNRISETLVPLPGDPNGNLTVILYGTPEEYQRFQWFLYDLPTNNGGIYIEQRGTFYTYNRTPQQSLYTLDELMRHEYSHYLIGRHLIEGLWGEEPIYANDRMVWFDEGLAEFLTWSTVKDGVQPRRALVSQIQSDGSSRMTIAQVLSATYGDFRFYRYAGTFFNFLYEQHKPQLRDLLRYAHTSNLTGFDGLINQMKANASLNAAYQSYLDQLVADLPQLTDPSTSLPGADQPSSGSPTALQQTFRTSRLGYLGNCTVSSASLAPRFTCRGVLSGSLRADKNWDAAWPSMDSGLNEIITQLTVPGVAPDNFRWMTCRFGLIRWVDYGAQVYPMADYFCEGPLAPGSYAFPDRLAKVTADVRDTRLGPNAACSLPKPDRVTCNVTLTTRAVPNGTSNAVLDRDLVDALEELANQMYAQSPSYYRNLSCAFAGTSTVIPFGSGQKYLSRPAECQVA